MKEKSIWLFIFFPAITMLLGWGLRGYIGGGPFGAMIPGAFVALSLALLYKLPVKETSVLVIFSAVGIGLGGEMTYGQTLGFLKVPETVWWGTLGTTLKGAVWGFLGGIILALGFIHKKLRKKTILYALLIMMAGMVAGFKLVNQPMLIYFSDPAKPRPESWAALLLGGLAMLGYLKLKAKSIEFKIVRKLALWGLISGGLGFGLGGFWMVLGFSLPSDVVFNNWWKMMEFTFGMLLGAGLGAGTWFCRKEISESIQASSLQDSENKSPGFASLFEKRGHTTGSSEEPMENLVFNSGPVWKNFLLTFLLVFVIFWLIPALFDPIVEKGYEQGNFKMPDGIDLAKILSNFAFSGTLMILAVLYFPKSAWHAGITLTFCYTAIDLMQDVIPEANRNSPFTLYFLTIIAMNLIVATLAAMVQRGSELIRNMFLLIVWSCMVIAFIRLTLSPEVFRFDQVSVCEIFCGRFFVHLVFLTSAIYMSWVSKEKIRFSE